MKDMVNHPSHYTRAGRDECIIEMEEIFGIESVIAFCRCNAFKYEYREGLKEGHTAEEDRRKKEFYLDYANKLSDKLKKQKTMLQWAEGDDGK